MSKQVESPPLIDEVRAVAARCAAEGWGHDDIVRHNLDNVVSAVRGLESALDTVRRLQREDG